MQQARCSILQSQAAKIEDGTPVRFDIAEVYMRTLRDYDINIIEDAFFDDSFPREYEKKKGRRK